MPEPPVPSSRLAGAPALALVGLLLAVLVNLPGFLIPAYRGFYQRKFPEVARRWPNNGSFTRFAALGGEGEDQLGIASRVLEAGRAIVPGDPYLGGPPSARLATYDTLGFVFLGSLQRLTGDLEKTWLLARLLSVLAFFMLMARLLRRLGAGPAQAVFAASFLTLFFDRTISDFLPTGNLLDLAKNTARTSLWLLGGDSYCFGPTHFMRPAVNYTAFLAAGFPMLAAAEAGRDRRGLGLGAAAGLAGGLLAYVHFDVWMLFCAAAPVFLAMLCAGRRPFRLHAPLAAACAAAALVSLPFFLIHFSPRPEEFEARPFLVDRSFYRPSLLSLAAAWGFWRNRGSGRAWEWLAAAQAATFLLLNLSMAAPLGVQRHYIVFAGNATLMPGLAVLAMRRFGDGERWLWGTALAAALALGRAVSYSAQLYATYAIPRDYESAFAWLRADSCRGKVVATLDGEVARLTPVHGGCLVLAVRANPFESDITNAENLRRTSYGLDLFAPPASRPAAVELFSQPGGEPIRERQAWAGAYDRSEFHRRPAGMLFYHGLFPTDRDPGRLGAGVDFHAVLKERLSRPAGPYRVDYLWEGPLERSLRPPGDPKPPGAGALAYENATVRVFRAPVP